MVTRDTNATDKPARPISMQQIAAQLGVSRATVSNALYGTGRLSAELAERIRQTAAELGYIPSAAALSLKTGRSTLFGLVVPDFTLPLFPVFAQAFERAAKRRDLALLIADSMGRPATQAEEVRNLVARGVEGLVVIPVRGAVFDLTTVPVPVVIVDSPANPMNTASSDHRDGGRQVARHLVDLGHRRVTILGSVESSRVGAERIAGMCGVFAAAGVTVRTVATPVNLDGARATVAKLDLTDVTALACCYDAQAVGAVAALTARGCRVPDDISVTGFDDTVWGQIVTPPLTTIRQDLAAIAEHALAVATGERDAPEIFPVSLLVRASTATPNPTKDRP